MIIKTIENLLEKELPIPNITHIRTYPYQNLPISEPTHVRTYQYQNLPISEPTHITSLPVFLH